MASIGDFEEWMNQKRQDPEVAKELAKLDPGHQVARLRILRGLTQAQLAALVSTQQPSIARLENGETVPNITFLERVAAALNARLEIRLVPEDQTAREP
jgi:transcriptional regulator with XRE-family HTH domain